MERWDSALQKQKYFEKLLSSEGQWTTWNRYLDQFDLFARQAWLDIPVFDLTSLGIGLMYLVAPIQIEPLNVFKIAVLPTDIQLDWGIYINFIPFDFKLEFPEFEFIFDFLLELFDVELVDDLISSLDLKAYWGIGNYDRSLYDPEPFRDYVRSTIFKLRQIRPNNISYANQSSVIQAITGAPQQNDDVLDARLLFFRSAQTHAFILGLSPLGTTKLSRGDGEKAVIPAYDAEGNVRDVQVAKLEELQFGLFLGIIPLGFGCLVPPRTVFRIEDPKKMPSLFNYIRLKAQKIMQQTAFSPFSWANYTGYRDIRNYHTCERATQYHSLQQIRQVIEEITESQLPENEKTPTRIRQYQNAMLQLIAYKAKRRKWGFAAFNSMTEEEFREYWLRAWESQGLNTDVLNRLYEVIRPYLTSLRELKHELGERVMRVRRQISEMLE